MKNIEKFILNNYQNNIEYFQKQQPDLYNKIVAFESALANQNIRQRYELIYEKNYFDVLDIATNSYLYNQNSIDYSEKIVNQINLKKSENSIETFYNFNFTEKTAETIDNLPIKEHRLGAVIPILSYTNKFASKYTTMKKIPKFIYFGVALGFHIPLLIAKLHIPYCFIIEDDIELFRLSLFTIDYSEIAQAANLIFSVADNDREFRVNFATFYQAGYMDNNYLKYLLLSDTYLYKIDLIREEIVSSRYMIYPYQKRLMRDIESPKFIAKGYNILNMKKIRKKTIFSRYPVLLLGAGPSLDKNIKFIKENQNKFIIVCVLSAAKRVVKEGISIDLILHLDPTNESLQFLTDGVYESLQNKPIIFSTYILENIVNLFYKDQVYLYEHGVHYKHGFHSLSAPSVGETLYAMMLIFNARNLFLLGLDLALDPETGSTHTSTHQDAKTLEQKESGEASISLTDSTIEVKGNFRKVVKTTPLFKLSIKDFGLLTKKYKSKNQRIFNLNDGAFLEGAEPLKSEQIDTDEFKTIDKDELLTQIQTFLLSISSNKFKNEDKKIIERKIQEALEIKNHIDNFKKSTSNSLIEFSNELSILVRNISNRKSEENSDIKEIFTNYFYFTLGHITSFFNTLELTDIEFHVENIQRIFSKQLLKIVNCYIDTMESYLIQDIHKGVENSSMNDKFSIEVVS